MLDARLNAFVAAQITRNQPVSDFLTDQVVYDGFANDASVTAQLLDFIDGLYKEADIFTVSTIIPVMSGRRAEYTQAVKGEAILRRALDAGVAPVGRVRGLFVAEPETFRMLITRYGALSDQSASSFGSENLH